MPLDQIVAKHFPSTKTQSENSEDEEEQIKSRNIKDIQAVSKKVLEDIAYEFQFNYKAKIEQITKQINQIIIQPDTKKVIFQKLLRNLMLKYSSFTELIKQTHSNLMKDLTPPHLILLDMKNCAATTYFN